MLDNYFQDFKNDHDQQYYKEDLEYYQRTYEPQANNYIGSFVNFDEYGEEIMNNNVFLATQPPVIPHTATFFSDSKNHANQYDNAQKFKKTKVKKDKYLQDQNKKAKKKKKKYSSEEDAQDNYQNNNNIKYHKKNIVGGYIGSQNKSEIDIIDKQTQYAMGNAFYNEYINQQNSDQVSGQTDFSDESSSSQEVSSSKRSSSSEESSISVKQKTKKDIKRQVSKKKDKKQNKKKKQPKSIKQKIDYQRIIEVEQLNQKLRIDNFSILQFLIQNKDQEVKNSFENHVQNLQNNKFEQSNLLSELAAKTEETYQMILEKAFSNEDQNIIRQKRTINNQEYHNIMKQFLNRNQFNNVDSLLNDLKEMIKLQKKIKQSEEQLKKSEQKKKQKGFQIEQKEKIEQVFLSILYDSFKGKPDKEKFLRQQFQAQNQDLLKILQGHVNNTNIQHLRVQISKFVFDMLGPDIYQSLREAINGLFERGFISVQDRDLIKQLCFKDDKHLMAAWEVYSVLFDEQDLVDTLKVLAEVKRKEQTSSNQNQKELDRQFGFTKIVTNEYNDQNSYQIKKLDEQIQQSFEQKKQEENNKLSEQERNNNQTAQAKQFQIQTLQDNMVNIQTIPQINQPWKQQQSPLQSLKDEQSLQEGQNYQNLSSGQRQMQSEDFAYGFYNKRDGIESREDLGEDDDEINGEEDLEQDSEDIESIVQYQHKILRKYAMLGMIQYSAIPFFHQLVQNRDYKMICIFEVFAQNRNEDDFLENLGILDEIRIRLEEEENNLQRLQSQQVQQINSAIQKNSSDQDEMMNEDGFNQQFNISLQLNQKMMVQNSQRNEDACNDEEQIDSDRIVISENIDNPQYLSDQRKIQGTFEENDEGQKMNSYSMNFAIQGDLQKSRIEMNQTDQQQSNENKIYQQEIKEHVEDENIIVLMQVKDKLEIEEFEWIKQKLTEQDKKFVSLVKCYKMTNDAADFLNTIQRFYKKAQK